MKLVDKRMDHRAKKARRDVLLGAIRNAIDAEDHEATEMIAKKFHKEIKS